MFKRRKTKTGLRERYPQYDVGRWTYGDPRVLSWGEGATLKVGAFCSIADGVKVFLGGEHRMDWATTFPFNVLWDSAKHIPGHPKTKGDVVIGNDVWLGAESVILSGVTIGDGAVVGARAVVSRDVKPYAVVAGNPAMFVRKRFDDHSVARLVELKWWDFDDATIEKLLPLMLNENIGAFLDEAERVRSEHMG